MLADNGLTDVGFSNILKGFKEREHKSVAELKKITYAENELGEHSTRILTEYV
jgi:hypothetical protein